MERIEVTIDSRLRMPSAAIPPVALEAMQAAFTYDNPKAKQLENMGRRYHKEPAIYRMWRQGGGEFSLPRGGLAKLRAIFDEFNIDYQLIDKRSKGNPSVTGSWVDGWQLGFDLFPQHKLVMWAHQNEMVAAAKKRSQILMRSPVGSGKTSAVIKLISEAQVPALVIVYDEDLLVQWQERIEEELGTPIADQGIIQGPKCVLKPITLAMQQTLNRWKEPKWEQIDGVFGMVVCDECFEASTPILMADGSYKEIKDVQIGDDVAVGGKVLDTMHRRHVGQLYSLNGSLVTSEHPVATAAGWIPISKLRGDDITWHAGEGGHRVGREQPQHAGPSGVGRAQDILPRIEGVVGVEIPGAGRLRQGHPTVQASSVTAVEVYNLETERNVYVAAGALVHNCQRYAASTFTKLIDRMDCWYRVAVTADERRKDKKTFIIYDMFGKVEHEVDQDRLVRDGIVHEVEVFVMPTAFTCPWYVQRRESRRIDAQDFNKLLDEMAADQERNALAIRMVRQCVDVGLPSLVFTHRVNHARELAGILTNVGYGTGMALGGKEWNQQFKQTVKGLRGGTLEIGCGTYAKLGVGHDIPSVAAGVCVTPVHTNRSFMGQVKGRICRTTKGKQNARIILLWDRLVFGNGPLTNLRKWNKVCRVWCEWDERWKPIDQYMREHKNGRSATTTKATDPDQADLFE